MFCIEGMCESISYKTTHSLYRQSIFFLGVFIIIYEICVRYLMYDYLIFTEMSNNLEIVESNFILLYIPSKFVLHNCVMFKAL